jgi:hypothetical protein
MWNVMIIGLKGLKFEWFEKFLGEPSGRAER